MYNISGLKNCDILLFPMSIGNSTSFSEYEMCLREVLGADFNVTIE